MLSSPRRQTMLVNLNIKCTLQKQASKPPVSYGILQVSLLYCNTVSMECPRIRIKSKSGAKGALDFNSFQQGTGWTFSAIFPILRPHLRGLWTVRTSYIVIWFGVNLSCVHWDPGACFSSSACGSIWSTWKGFRAKSTFSASFESPSGKRINTSLVKDGKFLSAEQKQSVVQKHSFPENSWNLPKDEVKLW